MLATGSHTLGMTMHTGRDEGRTCTVQPSNIYIHTVAGMGVCLGPLLLCRLAEAR
jgi:hypothetical protein